MPVAHGTVHDAFRDTAARYPDNAFLCIVAATAARYGIEARSYSYSEAQVEVERLEKRYRAARVAPGQRVGLMLENRPAFFFHWLALNAIGASVVPLSREWRSAELEYVVGHSELRIAVVPPERLGDLRQAGVSARHDIVVTTPDLALLREGPDRCWPPQRDARVSSGAGGDREQSRSLPTAGPDVNTECALLYTSGTTGRPKGCVLANEYFLWAGRWYAEAGGACRILPGSERLLTPLPMSHMNAMAYSTMVMLLTGGCIVPLDRFHPGTWWESVRESRATVIHYLGVMPAILLGAAASATDRDHAVRFGFGAGVSSRLHASFEERFGFPLLEAWAMTETGAGAVVIANREPRKVGTACFGRPESRIEYRVVDEAGRDVPPGSAGELLVRGSGPSPRFGFFREYLKDPAATADAWRNGYFHTGDIVAVDADGDFHFIDRKKNVIRRSGENISAVEVESVLLQYPGIAGVGVTAVPDELRGDEVMACVVLREALSDSERTAYAHGLLRFSLERLAYFKAPGYVGFCASLPLTATEKIQRAQLKEIGRELLGTPACIDMRSLKKAVAVA